MSTSDLRYHHGDLPAALLDAADALLTERGATALSLREVARRANVSHNAPYHHFPDRAALLKRLAERHMARLLGAQQAAADTASDPIERFRAIGLAYVTYAAEHPHGFGIVYDPEVCVPGSPTAEMAPLISANEKLLADTVAAVAPPMSAEELEGAANGAWGLVHGIAQLIVAGHLEPTDARPAFNGFVRLMAAIG